MKECQYFTIIINKEINSIPFNITIQKNKIFKYEHS